MLKANDMFKNKIHYEPIHDALEMSKKIGSNFEILFLHF